MLMLQLSLVVGTLKGYDQLMNLVLDDVRELLRGWSAMRVIHPQSLTSYR